MACVDTNQHWTFARHLKSHSVHKLLPRLVVRHIARLLSSQSVAMPMHEPPVFLDLHSL